MIIDDKIRDEKLQYDINREAAIISKESVNKFIYKNKCISRKKIRESVRSFKSRGK